MSTKTYNVEVLVTGNVEKSLRQLKKRIEREGVMRDTRKNAFHETKAQKRRKNLVRAVKNTILKNYEFIVYSKGIKNL